MLDYHNLSQAVAVKTVSENDTEGVFEIEGLWRGYGVMVGNALRRVLLSSLPGAAITSIKIKGVSHEFSTVPNVLEDVVELGLNFKRVRFRLHTDEPQVLTLKVKGEKKVSAKDISTHASVEVINPSAHIATLTDKKGDLDMEITVERGFGYVPLEERKVEKLPIGVVALDAVFSPIIKVNFSVEDMRVGDRADYNRVILSLETDGSIRPSEALKKASSILETHFRKIAGKEEEAELSEMMPEAELQPEEEEEEKKSTKKKPAKKDKE